MVLFEGRLRRPSNNTMLIPNEPLSVRSYGVGVVAGEPTNITSA